MDSFDPTRDYPSEDGIPGISGTTEPSRFFTRDNEHPEGPLESWDRRALVHVNEHLQSEQAVLGVYEAVRTTATGAVAYLIDLILADEARHHQMFSDLVDALTPPGRIVPVGATAAMLSSVVQQPTTVSDEHRAPMLQQTAELLEAELHDQRDLKRLQRELRPIRTETIWPLLMEIMELDTEKHIKMLHRIEQLLST
jgi:rubrerythrin